MTAFGVPEFMFWKDRNASHHHGRYQRYQEMEFRSYSQDRNKTGPEYVMAFLYPILKETILETEKIAI